MICRRFITLPKEIDEHKNEAVVLFTVRDPDNCESFRIEKAYRKSDHVRIMLDDYEKDLLMEELIQILDWEKMHERNWPDPQNRIWRLRENTKKY